MKPNDVVFLSASVPARRPWNGWCDPVEIEEAIVCVARAVFARGGRLLFGGHPSVSPLIASVAGEYFAPDRSRDVRPIVIFQSRLFEGMLPDETHLMAKMGWASIEWTEVSAGANHRDDSLRAMREAMLPDEATDAYRRNLLKPPRAMIGIGGMEGVVAETALAIGVADDPLCPVLRRSRTPVFLFRSGGGAAGVMADLPASPRDAETAFINQHFRALAERHSLLLSAERLWREAHATSLAQDVPFQPYAAIAQWLLDERL